jgi:hypothetical protein
MTARIKAAIPPFEQAKKKVGGPISPSLAIDSKQKTTKEFFE